MKNFILLILLPLISFYAKSQDVYSRMVGDRFSVTLLSEGQGDGESSILIGATDKMLERYAPDGTFPNAVNTFHVFTNGQNILFDTGYGRKLFDNLANKRLAPEDINVIILTHMHGDHIGGMLRDGVAAFPNAEVYISRAEHDYWTDPVDFAFMNEKVRQGFINATEVVNAYEGRVNLFDPSPVGAPVMEIFPGILAYQAYGHTPGHTVYLLKGLDESMLIWGDLTHAMAIQMPHPEVAVTYDVDPVKATESRREILEWVSREQIIVAGMHIAYPGIGLVSPDEDMGADGEKGYVFAPLL